MVLLIPVMAGTAFAEMTLELSEEFPERGTPVRVSLTGMAEGESYKFSATYRPNSETTRVEEVGQFADGQAIMWTPLDAGITALGVFDAAGESVVSKNIAVRFESPPVSGVLIFLLAGLLLFGGSTFFLRKALEE